jgi:hypothetical protein
MFKRWMTLVFALMLIATQAHAWDCHEYGITAANITSYIGFREDGLKWKVEGKRHRPIVVTEFCFDDVKMIEKGLSSTVIFCDKFALYADGDFSVAYNKGHDWAFDLDVAAGYQFDLCSCSIRLTPYVGYEINRERFHSCDEDFLTDIETCNAHLFAVSQLSSFYRAHWNSPFIGVDIFYAINECWKLYSDFAYHFVTLRGKGHSTLGNFQTNGFESKDRFHQRAHGWGITWETGLKYAIDCNWLLNLAAHFEYRKAHHGHLHNHHTFKERIPVRGRVLRSNLSNEGSLHSKHVEWRSLRIQVGVSYRF